MCVRILLLLTFISLGALPSWAGDEDVPPPPKRVEKQPEEIKPEPIEEAPEVNPEPALGETAPPQPKRRPVVAPRPPRPVRQVQRRREKWMDTNPDLNLDTARVIGMVRRGQLSEGVLPPALGVRAYRSTLFAVGAGDRTPGYGVLMEHSFDRVGIGFSTSYEQLTNDARAQAYSFYNLYALYRWLPYSVSPYIHGGVQYGVGTPISYGLLGGAGIDMKIYEGWTLYFGYTFHSIAEKGYMGGALGWAF